MNIKETSDGSKRRWRRTLSLIYEPPVSGSVIIVSPVFVYRMTCYSTDRFVFDVHLFIGENMIWRARNFRDVGMEEKAKSLKTPACDRLQKVATLV